MAGIYGGEGFVENAFDSGKAVGAIEVADGVDSGGANGAFSRPDAARRGIDDDPAFSVEDGTSGNLWGVGRDALVVAVVEPDEARVSPAPKLPVGLNDPDGDCGYGEDEYDEPVGRRGACGGAAGKPEQQGNREEQKERVGAGEGLGACVGEEIGQGLGSGAHLSVDSSGGEPFGRPPANQIVLPVVEIKS